MRKNIRKIPADITAKVDGFDTNLINVSTIIKVRKSELATKPPFPQLQMTITDDVLNFVECYQPDEKAGRYSKKNIKGYNGPAKKDLPKVSKSYCIGYRHPFGNTDAMEVLIYISRMVWQKDEYPPADWSIVTELIDTQEVDGDTIYLLKVGIDQLLDRSNDDFARQLHFALNLLLENIGSFDVYSSEATLADYKKTTIIDWEIFPAGTHEAAVAQIKSSMRNITPTQERNIEDRTAFLDSLNPIEYIRGSYLNVNYFGAKFSDNLFVFENPRYGNAVYVLFEDWQELTKLSRTDLLKLPEDKYIKVVHNKVWKAVLRNIISDRISKELVA